MQEQAAQDMRLRCGDMSGWLHTEVMHRYEYVA